MQSDLSPLEVPLSCVEAMPSQALDRSVTRGVDAGIDADVDDAVCAGANDRHELDATIVDEPGRASGRV
jgi:hypothetical protein